MEELARSLGAWDYVVFASMLVISAIIGIYHAVTGGRQKTTEEFLVANHRMEFIPTTISLLVSFSSAILILGFPAEIYVSGTQFYLYVVGMALACIVAAQLFVPLLYPLKLTSSFEYLQRRFKSKVAQITGTLILIVSQVIYMGISSFAPSTALESVTGFPVWATVVMVGCVASFYTTLGGMKAVVWTDVFQSIIMLAGLLAILIQGTILAGGMAEVWRINDEWHRIEFWNFDPDPTQRHTVWSLVLGSMILWTMSYGVNQASVQRYSGLSSLLQAKWAVRVNIIGLFVLVTSTALCGMVMFAYYAKIGCDPVTAGYVSSPNQLMPYFVMEILGYPALPGLFMACLFSGALSTTSSILNALTTVTWQDFLKPHFGHLGQRSQTLITKALVVLYGGTGVGVALLVQNLKGTVVQTAQSLIGASYGPLLGIFFLGGVFPWSNWIGCLLGGILGFAFPMWISIGKYSVVGVSASLPMPTYNCNASNLVNTTIEGEESGPVPELSGLDTLYTLSYMWYPSIGFATAVIVGLLVSFITGASSKDEVDSKYLIPLFDRLFCCFPASCRRRLQCGIEYGDPEQIRSDEIDDEVQRSANGIGPASNSESQCSEVSLVLYNHNNVTKKLNVENQVNETDAC